MPLDDNTSVPIDTAMTSVRERVRQRLRERLISNGGSDAFDDPEIFAEVEALLHTAASTSDAGTLILPDLLGTPDAWRLTTSVRFQSHRTKSPAALLNFVKRKVLMPASRWLFEYSRDNFERQRRTNLVLFACVQALALETAQLRRDVRRLSSSPAARPASRGNQHMLRVSLGCAMQTRDSTAG